MGVIRALRASWCSLAVDAVGVVCGIHGVWRPLSRIRTCPFVYSSFSERNRNKYYFTNVPSDAKIVKKSIAKKCFEIGGHPEEIHAYRHRVSGYRDHISRYVACMYVYIHIGMQIYVTLIVSPSIESIGPWYLRFATVSFYSSDSDTQGKRPPRGCGGSEHQRCLRGVEELYSYGSGLQSNRGQVFFSFFISRRPWRNALWYLYWEI